MTRKIDPNPVAPLDLNRLALLKPGPFATVTLTAPATCWLVPCVDGQTGWNAMTPTPGYTAALATERGTFRRFASLDSAATWLARHGIQRAYVAGLSQLHDQEQPE